MSSLPPQAVAEFQALWKKHCDAELPPDQAALRANEVFAVLRLVLEKRRPDAASDISSNAYETPTRSTPPDTASP